MCKNCAYRFSTFEMIGREESFNLILEAQKAAEALAAKLGGLVIEFENMRDE